MTLHIDFNYPIYTDLKAPKGCLDSDKRTHAAWTYYLLAHKLLEKEGKIEDQIRLEGELWMDRRYGDIARSVAIRYGLADPGEFLKPGIRMLIKNQCIMMGFPPPEDEYWNVEPGKVVTL